MSAPRRQLRDTMLDVAFGALTAATDAGLVTIRDVAVTLPVEIVLQRHDGQWRLQADVPRLLTRTAFDVTPTRLEVHWEAA